MQFFNGQSYPFHDGIPSPYTKRARGTCPIYLFIPREFGEVKLTQLKKEVLDIR